MSDIASFLLGNEAGKVVREGLMQLDVVQAVLKAADEWVSTQEALVAAQEQSNETEAEQEAVDVAGCRLVLAVTRWRSEREIG